MPVGGYGDLSLKNRAGGGGRDSDTVRHDSDHSLNVASAQKMVEMVLRSLQALCHLHFTDILFVHCKENEGQTLELIPDLKWGT